MSDQLLHVSDLTISLGRQSTEVLDHVSFEIAAGETVAILGESGAGKTTLARSLIGLLPARSSINGSILFKGHELVGATDRQWQKLRGSNLAMISQEPELALNPVLRISRQLDEVLRSHVDWKRSARAKRVAEALTAVGLADREIQNAFPNQLSGGQRQRAVIAQALIAQPLLLIADEPTSSLDSITQSEIIDLLKTLKAERQLTLLFITHHPGLLTGWCDRILNLRAGKISESACSEDKTLSLREIDFREV